MSIDRYISGMNPYYSNGQYDSVQVRETDMNYIVSFNRNQDIDSIKIYEIQRECNPCGNPDEWREFKIKLSNLYYDCIRKGTSVIFTMLKFNANVVNSIPSIRETKEKLNKKLLLL